MTVLPTVLEYDGLGGIQTINQQEKRNAVSRLLAVQQRAAAEGVECEILLGHGEEPYQEIVEEAQSSAMDLIIIGRRDRHDLTRILLGSTTAKVIGYSTCNVLVVPRGATFNGKGIVLAVDGSQYSDAASSVVAKLVNLSHAPVTAISVAIDERLRNDAKKIVDRVKDLLSKSGITVKTATQVGAPYTIIADTAKEQSADLIVMGSHGRTGFDRLLVGSVSERVIGRAQCPVLVVKSN